MSINGGRINKEIHRVYILTASSKARDNLNETNDKCNSLLNIFTEFVFGRGISYTGFSSGFRCLNHRWRNRHTHTYVVVVVVNYYSHMHVQKGQTLGSSQSR